MKEYIAFDVHKHYTLATVESADSHTVRDCRIQHQRGNMALFLSGCAPGGQVAVETLGNWY